MTAFAKYTSAFEGDQYVAMKQLEKILAHMQSAIAIPSTGFVDNPIGTVQSNPTATNSAPQPAQFAVAGVDGKFLIQIQNPQSGLPVSANLLAIYAAAGLNPQNLPIVHNLQSASTLSFDASSSLTDYGISAQLGYEFQNPNVTLFWRLRSSYNSKTWNKWQIYSSALTCGPVGVYSGLLRTAALSVVNGAATPTTQPLSAATGVSANQATINIAAFQVQYPKSVSPATGGLVSYSAGAITPLLDSTLYYVYGMDPSYSGGAIAYLATTDNSMVTASDGSVYLGSITTPAHGGGGTTGNGGGSGPCFLGSVAIITRDGVKFIGWMKAGDEVLTQRGWRKVRKLLVHDYSGPMHCVGGVGGEHVTPTHRFLHQHSWIAASEIFPQSFRFTGPVFNLEIEGDGSDEEQCYTLANGWIAHNQRKGA